MFPYCINCISYVLFDSQWRADKDITSKYEFLKSEKKSHKDVPINFVALLLSDFLIMGKDHVLKRSCCWKYVILHLEKNYWETLELILKMVLGEEWGNMENNGDLTYLFTSGERKHGNYLNYTQLN